MKRFRIITTLEEIAALSIDSIVCPPCVPSCAYRKAWTWMARTDGGSDIYVRFGSTREWDINEAWAILTMHCPRGRQDVSLGLSTAALLAPLAGALVGGWIGGEYGAALGGSIGELASMALGDASTVIDCAAEWTSISCGLGVLAAVAGPVGVDIRSTAKHVKLLPRIAGALGFAADRVAWATSFNEWLNRPNWGRG